MFGFRIARVKTERLTKGIERDVAAQCAQERIACLYFLAPSGDVPSRRCAEEAGFTLADIRMTFERSLETHPPVPLHPRDDLRFSLARRSDVRSLQKMAANLYPESRFAVDPHFPREAAPRLFAEWIARSVAGRFDDCVWLVRSGRTLNGFISCRNKTSREGSIGLIGVIPGLHGRGIGAALVEKACAWFQEHRTPSVSVVTQGSNVAAQRLYQKGGFRTERVELWYHKWFDVSHRPR
jgi:dTDP-4-amino-4,6-dideoxy-D-galactose acyltransferase